MAINVSPDSGVGKGISQDNLSKFVSDMIKVKPDQEAILDVLKTLSPNNQNITTTQKSKVGMFKEKMSCKIEMNQNYTFETKKGKDLFTSVFLNHIKPSNPGNNEPGDLKALNGKEENSINIKLAEPTIFSSSSHSTDKDFIKDQMGIKVERGMKSDIFLRVAERLMDSGIYNFGEVEPKPEGEKIENIADLKAAKDVHNKAASFDREHNPVIPTASHDTYKGFLNSALSDVSVPVTSAMNDEISRTIEHSGAKSDSVDFLLQKVKSNFEAPSKKLEKDVSQRVKNAVEGLDKISPEKLESSSFLMDALKIVKSAIRDDVKAENKVENKRPKVEFKL